MSTTVLGAWDATVLRWRRPAALLIDELTLLPLVMPLAPARSLADGAQTRFLDPLPFEILMRAQPTILTATDDELVECMRIFAGHLKTVVEPTGCLGLAAVRSSAEELRGQRVGVIISGGNVDLDRFAALIGTSHA